MVCSRTADAIKALEDGGFLYLLGTVNFEFMGQLYSKRWNIEACFQGLKGRRRFAVAIWHRENTLEVLKKNKKLTALVAIAYAICGSMGIYYHKKAQNIKKK